jgi:hypothetical protein
MDEVITTTEMIIISITKKYNNLQITPHMKQVIEGR